MNFKILQLYIYRLVVLLLLCVFSATAAVSQEVRWSKSIDVDNEGVVELFFEDSTVVVLMSGDSLSNLIVVDSAFNNPVEVGYDRSFSSIVEMDNSKFVSFTENGFSGVHRLDSVGQIQATIVLNSGRAEHPQLLGWHNDQLLLVDNYDYPNGAVYPRVTRLTSDLNVDVSFFLPQDFVMHLYADAVVNDRKELLITGVKEKLQQETELDQVFIRMDSTLDFEVAYSFGNLNNDWIGVENQSITSFPSGGLICGQTINGVDTNVTLSVVGLDGVPISNHVFSFKSTAQVSNESVVYFNKTGFVYCLVYTDQDSYLIITDLDGVVQKEIVFKGEKYHSVFLNNKELHLVSNSGILCLGLDSLGETYEECTLIEGNSIVQTNDSIWGYKNYFVQKITVEDAVGSASTKESSSKRDWFTHCPQIAVKGDLEGCKGDTVLLVASGDLGFSWKELGDNDAFLSMSDSIWLIVEDDNLFEAKGFYGSTVEVQLIESQNPECILDTLPIVFDYVSPNGDTDNDFFYIKNIKFIQPVSVTVVNAQNQLLFEDDNYQNDWSPIDLPFGNYFYSVKSDYFKKSGTLMIHNE